jgi:ATP-dependent Clp protease ATP-binding subunit ClpA
MTTNAGAESISRRTIGFTAQDHSTDGMEAINKMFTPEFRNRLDSVVQFQPLGEDVILTVVDKFLTELQGQLDEKRVTIDVDEDARLWLVEKGYDIHMGARPMERVIQEHIKKPLAEMVLFGKLAQSGGTARISLNKAEDKLEVTLDEEEVELEGS